LVEISRFWKGFTAEIVENAEEWLDGDWLIGEWVPIGKGKLPKLTHKESRVPRRGGGFLPLWGCPFAGSHFVLFS